MNRKKTKQTNKQSARLQDFYNNERKKKISKYFYPSESNYLHNKSGKKAAKIIPISKT